MGREKPKRRKFVKNYKRIFKVGKFSLGFLSVALFFIVTMLYLVQSNRMAVKGYDITELEKSVMVLKDDNEKLKLEASKLQSINVVKEGLEEETMIPVKQINYVHENRDVALKGSR